MRCARDFRDWYRKPRGGSSLPAEDTGSAALPRRIRECTAEGAPLPFRAAALPRSRGGFRRYRLLLRRGTMSRRTWRIKDRQYCAVAAAILMALGRTCDSTLSGGRVIMTRLFNNARVTGIRNQTGRTRAAARAARERERATGGWTVAGEGDGKK